MIKLGEIRKTHSGMTIGNWNVEKVWLCKNGKSGEYLVMGLVKDIAGIAHGWWTLCSTPKLKNARSYAASC